MSAASRVSTSPSRLFRCASAAGPISGLPFVGLVDGALSCLLGCMRVIFAYRILIRIVMDLKPEVRTAVICSSFFLFLDICDPKMSNVLI